GVRPRGLCAVWFVHMWDIVIDLLVERHHASHGPLGNIRSGEQTPNAEAARIGMALLQVIHVDHERQPGLPRGRFGSTALVLQPGQVLRFKAPDPAIDRRPGELQKPADTALTPALRVQLNDLATGVSAIRLAVIGAQGQLPLSWHRTLLPELFYSLIINALVAGVMNDPG